MRDASICYISPWLVFIIVTNCVLREVRDEVRGKIYRVWSIFSRFYEIGYNRLQRCGENVQNVVRKTWQGEFQIQAFSWRGGEGIVPAKISRNLKSTNNDRMKASEVLSSPDISIFFFLFLLLSLRPEEAMISFMRFLDHTQTHHSQQDSSGRVISPSQRHLPDKTQHSRETVINATGGIRTHDLSRPAAAELHLRLRDHHDLLPSDLYCHVILQSQFTVKLNSVISISLCFSVILIHTMVSFHSKWRRDVLMWKLTFWDT